ncbi:MAG: hypothetical protein ACKO0Z_02440 [Betaproteobacteria bacterium]|jgi:hypothetical protein
MKFPPVRYPSPLGRAQPIPMDVERTKREGWQNSHLLVIAANDQRLDFLEQQLIESIGNRLYGTKGKGGKIG